MVEITKECVLAIQPMVRYLWKEGVIHIDGCSNEIHCTNTFFFKAFKEFKLKERSDEYVTAFHDEDGIRWFCLIPKEVDNG